MTIDSFKIGLLFSLTGSTAITELGQCQAALLSVKEINESGGVNGIPLEPVIENIESDPFITVKKAEKLIQEDHVHVLLGVYTSACRIALLPVLEKYDILLIYPTIYEGNEQHDWVFYTGAIPNQQLSTFLPWITSNIGKSLYLVSSDYIYPREMNQHIRNWLHSNDGTIVGESYFPLGTRNFEHILKELDYTGPEVIFSTLVGNSVVSFYEQLEEKGLTIPICSPITAETEITAMQLSHKLDIYSAFPYFQTLPSKTNQHFVQAFQNEFDHNSISCVMESTYNSIYLLAHALRKRLTFHTPELRNLLVNSNFDAPQGFVHFEANQHLWQHSRIAKLGASKQFDVVWEAPDAIIPKSFISYPSSDMRSKRLSSATHLNKKTNDSTPFLWTEVHSPTQRETLYNEILDFIYEQKIEGIIIFKERTLIYSNTKAKNMVLKNNALIDVLLDALTKNPKEPHLRKRVGDALYDLYFEEKNQLSIVQFKPIPLAVKNQTKTPQQITFDTIVGVDPNFLQTIQVAKIAAQSDANVLIMGESGTGKEWFANAIHNGSSRKDQTFIPINCGAIPKDLMQSELFGYTEGAFTGAKKGGKLGLFEAANNGTLFLDEIGEMPLDLQVNLLRVLQEKEVTRIGSHQKIPVNVRIIAATNKNIMDEIAYNGSFRSDLYFRLNVFQIDLLPLRARKQDIPELVAHFLNILNQENGSNKTFSNETMRLFMGYEWPGNIRELSNIVERSYYLSRMEVEISPHHVTSFLRPALISNLDGSLRLNTNSTLAQENKEKQRIIEYLDQTGANISKVARLLNMSRTTLYKKINQYGIEIRR